jgi:hypothetical protein
MLRNPRLTAAGAFRHPKYLWMHFIKHGKQLALITTAVTLLAGAPAARADGSRPLANGGASLTGWVPAVRVQVQAPVTPTAPVVTAPTVPVSTVSPVSPAPVSPAPPAPASVPTPPAVPVPTPPTAPAPTSTVPTAPIPAPPTPPAAPISPGSAAISPPDPASGADSGTPPTPTPTPAASPAPAASNTTTQTITQVQVSTCVSHCDGGSQVQQASQGNTTVQAVGPPVPNDGGAAIVEPPASRTSTSTHSVAPTPPPPGVTQVQVGCLEHCYGTTTLDSSGLTLAQIEQLLGQLQVPSPPDTTARGGEQNTTQQTAAQSENGDGNQSQIASQANGTVQVVVTGVGAPADGGAGPAAVNQTAQGIAQLQVGCIFYCSGTQQTQQAQQSNATLQAVDSSGAGAANTVSGVIWQVQIGCVAWCYDAAETQTATGGDSSVVSVAPPPVAAPPAVVPPVAPPPAHGSGPAPSTRPRTRGSGGAPLRVLGAELRVGLSGGTRPVLGAERVTAVSVSAEAGNGAAFVSVAASQTVQSDRASHPARRITRRQSAPRPAQAAPLTIAGAGPAAVAGTSPARPNLDLALALGLAALGFAVWRRRRGAMM